MPSLMLRNILYIYRICSLQRCIKIAHCISLTKLVKDYFKTIELIN